MLYRDIDTPLHRMNPAAKLIGLGLFFIWAVAPTGIVAAIVPFAFSIAIAWWSGAGPGLRRVRFILILLFLFSLIFWTLQTKGHTVWLRVGQLTVYRESLLFAQAVAFRLIAMMIAGVVLLTTTRVEEFLLGLQQLRVPYPIAFTISLAFRLVPTFVATASTIVQAQKSRGLQLETGGIFARARKHIPLLIPVLVSSVRNCDLMAMALESRGFHPTKPRTSYLRKAISSHDVIAVACMALIALTAWGLYLHGIGVERIRTK